MSQIQISNTIDNIQYRIDHYFDTLQCYDVVKICSENYWKNNGKKDAVENYRFDDQAPEHSLGNMLKYNKFYGGFTILSINNNYYSFGGIRKYNQDTAIILARNFCFFTVKPITNGILLPFHLSVAKNLGFKKAWITINEYNIHWYKTWFINEFNKNKNKNKRLNSKLYTQSVKCITQCQNKGIININYVDQTILEWQL